ncbi:MAG TPA: SIP domain-containing protein [Oleiagrimonas sp.]|nr:SIP domain-containing protein [Oleiagrimonas sp.]
MMLSRLSAGQTHGPQVERIRHDTQPCELRVESVCYLTPGSLVTHWAHRPLSAGSDPCALLDILRTIEIAPDTLVWLAAEATVVRALRTYLLEERDCPQSGSKPAVTGLPARSMGMSGLGDAGMVRNDQVHQWGPPADVSKFEHGRLHRTTNGCSTM